MIRFIDESAPCSSGAVDEDGGLVPSREEEICVEHKDI